MLSVWNMIIISFTSELGKSVVVFAKVTIYAKTLIVVVSIRLLVVIYFCVVVLTIPLVIMTAAK